MNRVHVLWYLGVWFKRVLLSSTEFLTKKGHEYGVLDQNERRVRKIAIRYLRQKHSLISEKSVQKWECSKNPNSCHLEITGESK